MKIDEISSEIDRVFPLSNALEGDKVGLQVATRTENVTGILSAFELTNQVIEEALDNNCNFIVGFHPLIYLPLKKIEVGERVSNLLIKLIKNDIAFYSIHTSYDTLSDGANFKIANQLGLSNLKFIEEFDHQKGMGIYGELKNDSSLEEVLFKLEKNFISPIRYNEDGPKSIRKVGVVAGSGSSYLRKIEELGLDAFITADNTYHNFHRANGKYYIFDLGHFEMELNNHVNIGNKLNEVLSVPVIISKSYTNPVRYWNNKEITEKQRNIIN